MQPDASITNIGHVIQLSVAPVFLLSGIGAMLAVMTNRLSRVVDRARTIELQLAGATLERKQSLQESLKTFSRRAKLINLAVTFCTVTALLVCALVAILFLGAFVGFDVSIPIAALFVGAMSTVFIGLLYFLREIFIATSSLRIGPQ